MNLRQPSSSCWQACPAAHTQRAASVVEALQRDYIADADGKESGRQHQELHSCLIWTYAMNFNVAGWRVESVAHRQNRGWHPPGLIKRKWGLCLVLLRHILQGIPQRFKPAWC